MFIFMIIGKVISIYALLCFVRVMLTWFPGADYSPIGRFISSVCDPYLNIFRRFRFLRFSAFDFTPAIAMCVLLAASSLCTGLAMGGRFQFGAILAMIASLVWSIIASILFFLMLILVVRLIVLLLRKDSGGYSIWDSLDRAISPFVFRMTSFFSGRNSMQYKHALIIALILMILLNFAGRYVVALITHLLLMIPF